MVWSLHLWILCGRPGHVFFFSISEVIHLLAVFVSDGVSDVELSAGLDFWNLPLDSFLDHGRESVMDISLVPYLHFLLCRMDIEVYHFSFICNEDGGIGVASSRK